MSVMNRFRFHVALLATILVPSIACSQRPLVSRGEGAITEDLIRRHVNVIADDSMLGRNTPSRGLDMTASYIASQFKRIGLKPGGDAMTFIQRYPLARAAVPAPKATPAPPPSGFDSSSAPNVVG